MREVHRLEQLDRHAAPPAVAGGGPLADAVDGELGGFRKLREEEGAGGVRAVVLAGDDRPLPPQPLADRPFGGPRVEPREIGRARFREAGPELPGELLHRRLVVGDGVEVGKGEAAGAQAVAEGRHRQPGIVLHPREALLLGRRRQPAVAQQAAGGFVEEGGEAENVHGGRAV